MALSTSGRRMRNLAVILSLAVAVAVAGVIATRYVRSPQQALADLGPPVASLLLEPVERRVLTDVVTLRGDAAPAGSAVIDTAALSAGGTSVVTRVAINQAQLVSSGDVVLEVSGRPVLLLTGELPFYRDLLPGDEGPDVVQAQRALAGLGYAVTEDGQYGESTAAAVQRLYLDRGYSAPLVGDPLAVDEALRAVTQAGFQLDDATLALAAAKRAAAALPAEDEAGRAAAARGRQLAERARDAAHAELDAARQRADAVAATTGASLPRSEIVTVTEPTVRVERVGVSTGYVVGGTDPGAEGDPASDPTMDGTIALSWGAISVTGYVAEDRRGLLQPGQAVTLVNEVGGWTGEGRIADVGDTVVSTVGATGYPVVVAAAEGQQLPDDLSGANLRMTIATATTGSEVIVVPLSAVVADIDGNAAVDRMRGQTRERVVVDIGVTAGGFVEVTPRTADSLDEGDQVVVGIAAADDARAPRTTTP